MRKIFRSPEFSFSCSLAVLILAGLVAIPAQIHARQAIANDNFKIELPQLWNRSEKISPGFEVGFQKPMQDGWRQCINLNDPGDQ